MLNDAVGMAACNAVAKAVKDAPETDTIVHRELQMQYTQQMATMAIDTVIDEDKDQYAGQRRVLAAKRNKLQDELVELRRKRGEAMEVFAEKEKEAAAVKAGKAIKALLSIPGIASKEWQVSKVNHIWNTSGDEVVEFQVFASISCRGAGSVELTYEVDKLPAKIVSLNNAIANVNDHLKAIEDAAVEVGKAVSDLEQERVRLKRELNKKALQSSSFGDDMLKAVAKLRGGNTVKALPSGI
jgi:chromosome segregation ATPase